MNLDLLLAPGRVIIPATPEDAEIIKAVRIGQLLPVDVRRIRDGITHRKFHALVAFVAENHPEFNNAEDVMRHLKYKTGHCREFVTLSGKPMLEMLSTSWRSMDEVAFSAWVAKARMVIYTELFPGLGDRERIESQIESWCQWAM